MIAAFFFIVGEKSHSKSYGPFILHDLNSKWVQTHVCMAWRKKDFCYTILSSWTYGFEMTFEFFVQKDWAATAPFFTSKCVRILKLKSVGTAVNFNLPLTYEHKCRWLYFRFQRNGFVCIVHVKHDFIASANFCDGVLRTSN